MDSLSVLRDFHTNKRSHLISFSEKFDKVKFGEQYEFDSGRPTRFCKGDSREPYLLGALVLFMQCVNLSSKDYIERAAAARIARIARPDQQALKDFLAGHRKEGDVENITAEIAAPAVATKPQRQVDAFDISKHERCLRRRDNLLSVTGKDFSRVVDLFSKVEEALNAEKKKQERQPRNGAAPQAQAATQAARAQSRMDRGPAAPSDKQAQLGLNVYGSSSKQQQQQKRPRADGQAGPHAKRHEGSRSGAGDLKRPIIIVPQGETSMIGLLNAASLLRDGKFKTMAEARAALSGPPPTNPVSIRIPNAADPHRSIYYEIVDQAPSRHSERWTRVVAIVTQGKKWQFADYPYTGTKEGNTVAMFSSVCGFYFHYRDEQVPDLVRSWNVKCLELDRNARHNDIHVARVVFETIMKFLDRRRNEPVADKYAPRVDKLAYK